LLEGRAGECVYRSGDAGTGVAAGTFVLRRDDQEQPIGPVKGDFTAPPEVQEGDERADALPVPLVETSGTDSVGADRVRFVARATARGALSRQEG